MDVKPKQNRDYSRKILTTVYQLGAHLYWAHKLVPAECDQHKT